MTEAIKVYKIRELPDAGPETMARSMTVKYGSRESPDIFSSILNWNIHSASVIHRARPNWCYPSGRLIEISMTETRYQGIADPDA